MGLHPITVEIPEDLYDLLRRRAAGSQRTVQQELLHALGKKLAADESGADRMRLALEPMDSYSDAQLWDAARAHPPVGSCERSQELNDKQREVGLTPAERVELESLITQYEWHVLLRAKASELLKKRGHDISPLIRAASVSVV